jgi:hypothetical protein
MELWGDRLIMGKNRALWKRWGIMEETEEL